VRAEHAGRSRRTYLIEGKAPSDTGEPVLLPAGSHLVADPTGCSGCRLCEMVCSLTHEGVVAPSRATLTVSQDVFVDEHAQVLVCPQCAGPECLLACPRGAIAVAEVTGARVVVDELCDGCGICAQACHLGMIRVDAVTGKARKCDLCDGDPQCVASCPQKVLSTVERRAS
jgi:carbon-monoxide dehydrogenase iron sulfur subunit